MERLFVIEKDGRRWFVKAVERAGHVWDIIGQVSIVCEVVESMVEETVLAFGDVVQEWKSDAGGFVPLDWDGQGLDKGRNIC